MGDGFFAVLADFGDDGVVIGAFALVELFDDVDGAFVFFERALFLGNGEPEGVCFFEDVADDVGLLVVNAGFADDENGVADGELLWLFEGADEDAAGAVVNDGFFGDDGAVESEAVDEFAVGEAERAWSVS